MATRAWVSTSNPAPDGTDAKDGNVPVVVAALVDDAPRGVVAVSPPRQQDIVAPPVAEPEMVNVGAVSPACITRWRTYVRLLVPSLIGLVMPDGADHPAGMVNVNDVAEMWTRKTHMSPAAHPVGNAMVNDVDVADPVVYGVDAATNETATGHPPSDVVSQDRRAKSLMVTFRPPSMDWGNPVLCTVTISRPVSAADTS